MTFGECVGMVVAGGASSNSASTDASTNFGENVGVTAKIASRRACDATFTDGDTECMEILLGFGSLICVNSSMTS